MLDKSYEQFANLSPFELKDRLIEVASSDAQRLMLNAGRGNPNFVATLPRWAFLALGEFAMGEAERSYSYLDIGLGGLPEHKGISQRFEMFAGAREQSDGIRFLRAAVSFVKDRLGLDQDAFLYEMTCAFLGCNYPTPPRMLKHVEEITKAYIAQEMFGRVPPSGAFSLFATEGGTAAMTYVFQSLRANGLIHPGDKIAIATPIFSPYLEIPVLDDFQLEVVDIRMDRLNDWQLPDAELAKLRDPSVKVFCIVNPSNPPSTKMSDEALEQLAVLVKDHAPGSSHRHRRRLRHVRRRFRLDFRQMPPQHAVRLFVLQVLRGDGLASRGHGAARRQCVRRGAGKASGSREAVARQTLQLADHDPAIAAIHRSSRRRQPRGGAESYGGAFEPAAVADVPVRPQRARWTASTATRTPPRV